MGREPLATLPHIFPVDLAEAFIQPLDRKTKTKGKMFAMVRDIHKLTLRIGTWVNTEKFLFATSAPRIFHKAFPGDRLVTFDAHIPLPFALQTFVGGLFFLVHSGARLRRLHRGDVILIDAMSLTESSDK